MDIKSAAKETLRAARTPELVITVSAIATLTIAAILFRLLVIL